MGWGSGVGFTTCWLNLQILTLYYDLHGKIIRNRGKQGTGCFYCGVRAFKSLHTWGEGSMSLHTWIHECSHSSLCLSLRKGGQQSQPSRLESKQQLMNQGITWLRKLTISLWFFSRSWRKSWKHYNSSGRHYKIWRLRRGETFQQHWRDCGNLCKYFANNW